MDELTIRGPVVFAGDCIATPDRLVVVPGRESVGVLVLAPHLLGGRFLDAIPTAVVQIALFS